MQCPGERRFFPPFLPVLKRSKRKWRIFRLRVYEQYVKANVSPVPPPPSLQAPVSLPKFPYSLSLPHFPFPPFLLLFRLTLSPSSSFSLFLYITLPSHSLSLFLSLRPPCCCSITPFPVTPSSPFRLSPHPSFPLSTFPPFPLIALRPPSTSSPPFLYSPFSLILLFGVLIRSPISPRPHALHPRPRPPCAIPDYAPTHPWTTQ